MLMETEVDTLILGGGCAGLSLGVRLAERSHNTLILESRSSYSNDRTWCFWRHRAHRWEHLVSHAWSALSVSSTQAAAQVDCGDAPYQMIEAGRFYDAAKQTIDASAHVELCMDATVADVPRLTDGRWCVRTATRNISARHVVDTRPPRLPRTGDALLWQSFLGQEVTWDANVVDPHSVTLMDFVETAEVRQTHGVMFTYVLPFSATRALIHTTVFGTQPVAANALAGHQARALQKISSDASVLGGGAHHAHHVERSESGILPMGMNLVAASPGAQFVHAGLMSGGARPSTGYAFQRIQQWAESCAVSLQTGRGVIGHAPDSALRRAMDRLFLRVIRDYPEHAPAMFVRLFAHANPARVLRFLSDEGSLVDALAVIATLPPAPFLRTLLRAERQ
jgi:lycopene beta-cyclase